MASEQTPQDKKARSLARDRRNSYGENDKSSRTAIRSRKRWVNRIARQASRQAIQHGLAAPVVANLEVAGMEAADLEVADFEVANPGRRSRWRKSPDAPLGEMLYWRRIRRFARALAARLAEDPAYLERLEVAAVHAGLPEVAARMVMRQLRARHHGFRRDAAPIPDDALRLLQRLVQRLS